MQNAPLVRNADIVGMIDAVLWIIGVIMQSSLGFRIPIVADSGSSMN